MPEKAEEIIVTRLRALIGEGTVRGFSRKVGLPEGTIRGYLSGQRRPDLYRLIKIAQGAGVSVSWLVGEVDGPARAAASPPGGEAGEIKMSEMLTMASRVLESQTEYRQALAANIRAFHHAVEMEEEMSELKREFEAMRAEIGELKELILSIRGQAEPPKKSASA